MTPRQRQEMGALVASLGPGRVWVLLLDADGALVPIGEARRLIRNGKNGSDHAPGALHIDGLEVEVTTLETGRNGTALAYVVHAPSAESA